MDNQRISRASWNSVVLSVARVSAAIMLVFGAMGAIAALNLGESLKGHLPVNWPGFATSSAMTLAGIAALYFIEPRIRRKS
jgi:hypothetical protein